MTVVSEREVEFRRAGRRLEQLGDVGLVALMLATLDVLNAPELPASWPLRRAAWQAFREIAERWIDPAVYLAALEQADGGG